MRYGRAIDSMLDRARELFDPVQVRLYTAAIISRLNLRAPYGARRQVRIDPSQPVQLAHNDSKSRVLRVDIQFDLSEANPGDKMVVGDSPMGLGATSFVIGSNPGFNAVGPTASNLFVLLPEEHLYALTSNFPAAANVGMEWY